jgi:gas vesicle structural protein
VVEVILDRGIVIDAYVRVSLVGIELLTIDARVVVASVDTYLRFAEATNRLELEPHGGQGLPELIEEGGGAVIERVSERVVQEKVEPVVGPVRDAVRGAAEMARDTVDDLVGDEEE